MYRCFPPCFVPVQFVKIDDSDITNKTGRFWLGCRGQIGLDLGNQNRTGLGCFYGAGSPRSARPERIA
jgi:hypothetical protein